MYERLYSVSGSNRNTEEPLDKLKINGQNLIDSQNMQEQIKKSELVPGGRSMISVIAMDESRAAGNFMESEHHNFQIQEASDRELIIEDGNSGILFLIII